MVVFLKSLFNSLFAACTSPYAYELAWSLTVWRIDFNCEYIGTTFDHLLEVRGAKLQVTNRHFLAQRNFRTGLHVGGTGVETNAMLAFRSATVRLNETQDELAFFVDLSRRPVIWRCCRLKPDS